MKSFMRAAVLTAVTVAVAAGSVRTAVAQTVPATKVGVVNVGLLFSGYEKAKIMKKELDDELKPLRAQAESIKAAMIEHKKWLETPGNAKSNPQQAETSQKALRDGARALEDLDLRARQMVGKKQETQLIQLYREVQTAVQSYAQQNGFHIVLGYGDPPQLDPYTFANINRRMTAMDMGTTVVMRVSPGLDISQEVLTRLNASSGVSAIPVSGVRPDRAR